ncbi:hypothetical protein HRbin10_02418 [bacterium HR10]|nr:hypothetical protein HRbin10_02418 [bacterium HR10]
MKVFGEEASWTARRRWMSLLLIVGLGWAMAGESEGRAALQVGRIKGKVIAVTADRREPLAGVLVVLSGEFLPGKVAQTISDDDGSYSFSDLPPGDYVLSVEVEGFERFAQKIMLPLGAIVEVPIELKPKAVREAVTITAGEDELRRVESNIPAQLGAPLLRNAPLVNEKFQDALPLLPGVVRGPDGLLNVKGARAAQSGILVSSINATDPVTGQAAVELPIEAVETIQVYSNPYSAEFGKFTGAVTAIETRAGTNEWKYLLTNFVPRLRKRAGTIMGIESATPRFALSGPLARDRLFFFQGLEYRFVRTRIPSLPDLQNDTRLESFDSFSRFDAALTSAHRLTLIVSVFPQKLDFVNLNTFNPMATTPNFHQRGWFVAVHEQAAFSNGSLLQSSFSLKDFDADIYGNSPPPFRITPNGNAGGWFNRQHRESRRYEWAEVYHLPTFSWGGQHAFKIGSHVAVNTFTGLDRSDPVHILRADGTLAQLEIFLGEGRLQRRNTEVTFYGQDKWTVHPRLTLDWGLRYDRDGIAGENNLAPRVGFVLLPFADPRTIVRGGVGLFYDKVPLNVGAFEQYQTMQVTRFGPDGRTITDGPRVFSNIVEGGSLRTPRSTAWSVQVDRELTRRVLVRFGYEERRSRRDFILEPTRLPTGESALVLSNRGRSRYREFQILTRLRLQERHELFLAYVRSRAEGDLNAFSAYIGNFHNPIIRPNEYSRLPFDAPNRVLLWGDVRLPFDLLLSPVVDWRDGFPFSLVDEEQNFVGPRNRGGRFPRFFSLDLQITKGVTIPFFGKKYRTRLGVKIFNVTNHWNPRDVQNNIHSPAFGTFYNSVPRTFRGKFEIEF